MNGGFKFHWKIVGQMLGKGSVLVLVLMASTLVPYFANEDPQEAQDIFDSELVLLKSRMFCGAGWPPI